MLHISVWDKTLIHYWQLLSCQELKICAHKWNCSDVKMPLAADGFCLFWQLSNRCQPHCSWQNTDHFCFIKNLRLSHMTEIFLIISWLWLHMASMGFCPCWQLSRRCQLHQMIWISLLCAYWQVITSLSPLTVFLQLDCLLSQEMNNWTLRGWEKLDFVPKS